MKHWFNSHFVLGLSILASLLVLHRADLGPIESMRHHSFDLYQQLLPREPDPSRQAAPVRVIDIDEEALREVGQWPWSRVKLAELVEKLTAFGVSVIGFDMVFAEEDRASPRKILLQRNDVSSDVAEALKALPDNEDIFANAIAKSRVVLGQVGLFEKTPEREMPRKVGYGMISSDPDHLIMPWINRYEGLVGNLGILEDSAAGIGLFSTRAGHGGSVRRIALIERIDDQIYPSLSLEMLRVALGGQDDYLLKGYKDGSGGVESITVKTANPKMRFKIPTDAQGRVYVYFAKYPTARRPLYISAADVLSPDSQEDRQELSSLLNGALVVIGTSAVGLKDIRQTPINDVMPGVEVHAQLLENVLSDTHLTRPDEVIMIEWVLIAIAGLAMIVLIPRLSAIWTFFLTVSVIGLTVLAAAYYYTEYQQLLDASYPSLALFSLFLLLGYLNYAKEEKQRKQVKNAFGHYVSPALLDELADNPEKLALGGETRNITVLFSDIRGFTTISERFNAQELTRFINRFLTPMTNVIMEHGGTIDKYMGDAIMAFWNAPMEVDKHPHAACHAALEMQQAVKALNEYMRKEAEEAPEVIDGSRNRRHYMPIQVGVGLNTDDCCVGNMGSDQRFDYSALGDGVNLASRLEGQSKTYGVDIVIGDNTAQLVKDEFALIELDLLQVKGKTEPVRIFALMGDERLREEESFRSMQAMVNDMLKLYRQQRWKQAEEAAKGLMSKWPELCVFAELICERIQNLRQFPPPKDWDGVAIATSK